MKHDKDEKAIVLAWFGATYPKALAGITAMQREVREAFPETRVEVALTSNMIRRIWQGRRGDKDYLAKHKGVPAGVLYAKGPLAAIADLQDEGYRTIIVQPTFIYGGEEFADLASYIRGLDSIETVKPRNRPFKKLLLGRPLLGMPGPRHDYHQDMAAAAAALGADVELAGKDHAALVYMGHGNKFHSTGAYIEFQQVMREMYPETPIFIGTVEGFPSLDYVLSAILHVRVKKVLLKPLMMVAAEHAGHDMAGDQDDSWKSVLSSQGIEVRCMRRGLGEKPEIRDIFIRHLRDTAGDNHITLPDRRRE